MCAGRPLLATYERSATSERGNLSVMPASRLNEQAVFQGKPALQ